jgi:hypothetical protein
MRRLVYATVDDLRHVEFRSGEGVQFPGWDGYVEAPTGTIQVPKGVSCWELGTSIGITAKANEDYTERTQNPLGIDTHTAAFIFVTPRRWAGKTTWAQERQAIGDWHEVRAYDADDLEAWLLQAPGVAAWLARQIDKYPPHVTSMDDFWNEFSSTTNPTLTTGIVLAGREPEQNRITTWLRGQPSILHLRADTQAEGTAFVTACIMGLPEEDRDRVRSRSIITDDAETLRALSMLRTSLTICYNGENTSPATVAVQHGHPGFGFVVMTNDAEAVKAINALNGTDLEGRTLSVNEARPKTDRPKD